MTGTVSPFDGDQLQDSTYARADMARTRFACASRACS